MPQAELLPICLGLPVALIFGHFAIKRLLHRPHRIEVEYIDTGVQAVPKNNITTYDSLHKN